MIIQPSKDAIANDCAKIKEIANNMNSNNRYTYYATIGKINGPTTNGGTTRQLTLLSIAIDLNGKIIHISDHMHLSLNSKIDQRESSDCDTIIRLMMDRFNYRKSKEDFIIWYTDDIVDRYIAASKEISNKYPNGQIISKSDQQTLNQNDDRIKISFTADVNIYEQGSKAKLVNLGDIEPIDGIYWKSGDPKCRDTIFTHNKKHRNDN